MKGSPYLILLLGLLATYRLSMLISVESGPGRILREIRKLPKPRSATREGLSCPHCVGAYVAAAVAAVYAGMGWIEWHAFPLWWLAMAGASSAIVRIGRSSE